MEVWSYMLSRIDLLRCIDTRLANCGIRQVDLATRFFTMSNWWVRARLLLVLIGGDQVLLQVAIERVELSLQLCISLVFQKVLLSALMHCRYRVLRIGDQTFDSLVYTLCSIFATGVWQGYDA